MRRLVAHLVILGLLGATAASIATGIEVWPICNYPMFSEISRQNVRSSAKLVVVHGDGTEHRFPRESPIFYREFDAHSTMTVVRRFVSSSGALNRAKAGHFLALVLDAMHRSTPEGAPAAERPRALRLYWVRRDPSRPELREQHLLLEVPGQERAS